MTLLVWTSAQAENVKLRYSEINSELKSDGLEIEQVQAKLRCHFVRKKDGGNLIRRRYVFSKYDAGKLWIKKASLTEWLPGFDLRSCAYILIVLGKDEQGKSMMGDIVLMGQVRGDMSADDLRWMQDRTEADVYLNKRLEDITLVSGKDTRGRRRIVIQK